jgi:hypothetical protein
MRRLVRGQKPVLWGPRRMPVRLGRKPDKHIFSTLSRSEPHYAHLLGFRF